MKNDAFVKSYLDDHFREIEMGIKSISNRIDLMKEFVETSRVYNSMQFGNILRKEDLIMSALTDLQQGLNDQASATADIGKALENISGDIASLQKQVAAGQGVTEGQLQPLASQAKAGAVALRTAATALQKLADSVPDEPATVPPTDPGP